MIAASQLRPGIAIRFEGQPYKVVAADYHPGQGKMGGQAHTRLQNLSTGTFWEHAFRAELKLEEISLAKRPMEFLYDDAESCCFMDPETFEQTEVLRVLVGERAAFLEPGMRLSIEFVEDRPVSVLFPDVLEVKVADTAPAGPPAGRQRLQARRLRQRRRSDGPAVRQERRYHPSRPAHHALHGSGQGQGRLRIPLTDRVS